MNRERLFAGSRRAICSPCSHTSAVQVRPERRDRARQIVRLDRLPPSLTLVFYIINCERLYPRDPRLLCTLRANYIDVADKWSRRRAKYRRRSTCTCGLGSFLRCLRTTSLAIPPLSTLLHQERLHCPTVHKHTALAPSAFNICLRPLFLLTPGSNRIWLHDGRRAGGTIGVKHPGKDVLTYRLRTGRLLYTLLSDDMPSLADTLYSHHGNAVRSIT